jgi:hypothetical protein
MQSVRRIRKDLPTHAQAEAHRSSFVLALDEWVPRAMDRRFSGC